MAAKKPLFISLLTVVMLTIPIWTSLRFCIPIFAVTFPEIDILGILKDHFLVDDNIV